MRRRWPRWLLMIGLGWYGLMHPVEDGWMRAGGVTICVLWIALVGYLAGYDHGSGGATDGEGERDEA